MHLKDGNMEDGIMVKRYHPLSWGSFVLFPSYNWMFQEQWCRNQCDFNTAIIYGRYQEWETLLYTVQTWWDNMHLLVIGLCLSIYTIHPIFTHLIKEKACSQVLGNTTMYVEKKKKLYKPFCHFRGSCNLINYLKWHHLGQDVGQGGRL